MSYIAANFDEVQEQSPVEIGQYELQITRAELTESGEDSKHPGSPLFKISLGFVDTDLNAPNITHYISLPFDGDGNAAFKLLMLKRFLVHFNVPEASYSGGFDPEQLALEMTGQTAMTEVGLAQSKKNPDVTYNDIRLPRLATESRAGGGKPPRRRS